MNIREVKEYLEANANAPTYVADELAAKGYGQTKGGYRKYGDNKTQKWHFTVSYYGIARDVEGLPTYNQLWCPELILWIAEVAGLDKTLVEKARDFLMDFEDSHGLRGKEDKGAKYFYNASGVDWEIYKELCHIEKINSIICEKANWDEVMNEVKKIK